MKINIILGLPVKMENFLLLKYYNITFQLFNLNKNDNDKYQTPN